MNADNIKFRKLAEKLTESIVRGEMKPGEPLPSQYEMSETYGLSRSCIQKALDVLDGKGLIVRKPGKGVFVRDMHAIKEEGRIKRLAYVMPDYIRVAPHPLDNYGLGILSGIERECRTAKACVLFTRIDINAAEETICGIVSDLEVDGVVAHKDIPDDGLHALCVTGVPTVVAGRMSALQAVGVVAPNIMDSFMGVFRRLAAQGVAKADFVYNGSDLATMEVPALAELARISGMSEMRLFDYRTENDVFKYVETLVSDKALPEVFCCFNDWGAKHVVAALSSLGRKVPDDAGVIGAVDFDFSQYMSPSLTTLAVDPVKIGSKSVELLVGMLKGGVPLTERIPMTLVQRESFVFKPQEGKG